MNAAELTKKNFSQFQAAINIQPVDLYPLLGEVALYVY